MLSDKVKADIAQLLRETDDVDDALNYASDIATEHGVMTQEVIDEIRIQGLKNK